MNRRSSLWKSFLKKGFALFTILMMLGQLGQGAVTALAQELAVGDNGALDVTLLYGDKQELSMVVWTYNSHLIRCLATFRLPLRI